MQLDLPDRDDISLLRPRRLRWRGSILVSIAASSCPLYVMAANPASIVRPERILVIVAIAFVFGMLLIQVLNAFGMPVEPSEALARIAQRCRAQVLAPSHMVNPSRLTPGDLLSTFANFMPKLRIE